MDNGKNSCLVKLPQEITFVRKITYYSKYFIDIEIQYNKFKINNA